MIRSSFSSALPTLIAAFVSCISANASLVVIPSAFASTEGGNSNGGVLGPNARTFQYDYSSSVLTLHPGDSLIGLAFRLNTGVGAISGALSWTQFDIQIATSTAAPGSLSTTFATNAGTDATTVRSGALNFAAGAFPTGHTPNSFGPEIHFSMPFTYAGGDLLITIRTSGNGQGTAVLVDSDPNTSGSYQGQGSTLGSSATVANGATSTTAIMELDVAAPEPGTLMLMAGGMLIAMAGARARRVA